MPAGSESHYFMARLEGRDVAAIASEPGPLAFAPAWTTYIAVDDADAAAAKVRDAGGTVSAGPFDVHDAGRMAVCADPSGAGFCLWQSRAHRGAQLVNAPGTWNFSDLHTDDVARAKAFYGTVFGWEFDTIDFGVGESTMVRLPGYGDFLLARDPELRERQDAAGAPPGFNDAIAWMMPLAEGDATDAAGPRWVVTFTVDDTDATAAHAAELGGAVVMPPYEEGPVRVAQLRDPQGVAFTVSRYDPSGAG
jgi:predicted enzyme related to lactoylglutathione lyase